MDKSTSTRRAFVGSALAGAALMTPVARAAARRPAPDAGTPDAAAPRGEIAHWQVATGRRFRLASAAGTVTATLAAVVPATTVGLRPAHVRQQPFHLGFVLDGAHEAFADAVYTLDRPVAGLGALFMSRAVDDAGQARLTAVVG